MNNEHNLKLRLENLHSFYLFKFANKPRVTRFLDEIKALVFEAKSLHQDIQKQNDPELKTESENNLILYEEELDAINQTKKQGPLAEDACKLGLRANFLSFLYSLNFAGKDRKTRDIELLKEINAELAETYELMLDIHDNFKGESLLEDLDFIKGNLKVYSEEVSAIKNSQKNMESSELADFLADLANRQFDIYNNNFANKNRASRRWQLLERAITNLKFCQSKLLELKVTSSIAEVDDNLSVIERHLEVYTEEIQALKYTENEINLFEKVRALDEALTEQMDLYFSEYAGQDRATRDKEKLISLFKNTLEIEKQMFKISKNFKIPENEINYNTILDALILFRDEIQAIEDAKNNQDNKRANLTLIKT